MRLEGVTYQSDWSMFEPGRSFFVPCLDDKTGIEKITAIMKRLGFPVIIKVVIEDGVRGLRVWRIRR
jgi:biotin carboxylase